MALFLAMLWVNDQLFRRLEFAPGINWIYLPAGARLLCTLLFAEAGAIGLLIVSWLVSFLYLLSQRPGARLRGRHPRRAGALAGVPRGLAGLGAAGLAAQPDARTAAAAGAGLSPSPARCCTTSPFAWRGQGDLLARFFAMFAGDLAGTLIVLYGIKGLLALPPQPAAEPQSPSAIVRPPLAAKLAIVSIVVTKQADQEARRTGGGGSHDGLRSVLRAGRRSDVSCATCGADLGSRPAPQQARQVPRPARSTSRCAATARCRRRPLAAQWHARSMPPRRLALFAALLVGGFLAGGWSAWCSSGDGSVDEEIGKMNCLVPGVTEYRSRSLTPWPASTSSSM